METNKTPAHDTPLKVAADLIRLEKEGTLLICRLAEEQRIKEFSKI